MKSLLSLLFVLFLFTPVVAQTATQITIPEGRTSAMVSGKVPANSTQVFVLEGWRGAALGVYLASADKNGAFEIIDPNGNLFAKSSPDKFGGQEWKGVLETGGLFTITVFSSYGIADFQMTVEMP